MIPMVTTLVIKSSFLLPIICVMGSGRMILSFGTAAENLWWFLLIRRRIWRLSPCSACWSSFQNMNLLVTPSLLQVSLRVSRKAMQMIQQANCFSVPIKHFTRLSLKAEILLLPLVKWSFYGTGYQTRPIERSAELSASACRKHTYLG